MPLPKLTAVRRDLNEYLTYPNTYRFEKSYASSTPILSSDPGEAVR